MYINDNKIKTVLGKPVRLLSLLFSVLGLSEGMAAAEVTQNQDGSYRISNAFVSATIQPEYGGRISSLIYKGRELTQLRSSAESPHGSGLLADRIYGIKPTRTTRRLENSAYTVVKFDNGATASITLQSPPGELQIVKKISLDDKTSLLRVDYELTNPTDHNFTGQFWSCNIPYIVQEKSYVAHMPRGRHSDRMAKTDNTIVANVYRYTVGGGAIENHFVYEPQKDYAWIGGPETGILLSVPFPLLEKFYSYFPAESNGSPSLEWFTMPFMLKPLSKGKADAVNHPELADPLQDYVYRFSMSIQPIEVKHFEYDTFRADSKEEKSTRYAIVQDSGRLYDKFEGPAFHWGGDKESKTDLLAVLPATAVGEMAEFARRFPYSLTLVETAFPHVFTDTPYLGWAMREPAKALALELDKNPKLIVLSGMFERALPRELVERLVSAVKNGATVIYISYGNYFPSLLPGEGAAKSLPAEVTNGVLWDYLPATVTPKEYALGQGRVIHVPFHLSKAWNGGELPWTQEGQAMIPYFEKKPKTNLPYWEYYFAFYGKLLRYASNRTPAAVIKNALWKKSQIELQIDANVTEMTDIDGFILWPDGKTQEKFHWNSRLVAGNNILKSPHLNLNMPLNGDYIFHIRTSRSGSTDDWFAFVYEVKQENGIKSLETGKYHYEKDEKINLTVDVDGTGELHLRIRDCFGRVVAHKTVANAKGRVTETLYPKFIPGTPLLEVEAELIVGKQRVDFRKSTCTVAGVPPNKIDFLIWNYAFRNWVFESLDRRLGEIGFTVATFTATGFKNESEMRAEAESAMSSGLRYIPLQLHEIRASQKNLKDLKRSPCMRSPEYIDEVRRTVGAAVEKTRGSVPYAYFSGDESSLGYYDMSHDFCQSESCLKAFRKSMQEKYSRLADLNKAWSSAFEDWDRVVPDTFSGACSRKNYRSWYEHRLFMMSNIPDTLKLVKETLRQKDANARLGISGQLITGIHGAFNWPEALKHVDYPIAYINLRADGLPDMIRHNLLAGGESGAWIGYGAPMENIRYSYWSQLFNGMFSPSYWWYAYLFRRGDGGLTPDGVKLQELFREINSSGADIILTEGERMPAGVAVVYSIPSFVISRVVGQYSPLDHNHYTRNFSGWCMLLRDLGFQAPMVIETKEIANLDPARTPLLVLPMTFVLSDDECLAVAAYVRAGGRLIADAPPGLFDAYGAARVSDWQQKILGLTVNLPETSGNPGTLLVSGNAVKLPLFNAIPRKENAESLAQIGNSVPGLTLGDIRIEPSSKRIADAALRHKYGKGVTLYLNFTLGNYGDLRARESEALPVLAAMRTILDNWGFRADPRYDLAPGCQLTSYFIGGNRYLGLCREETEGDGKCKIQLGKKYYIYDMLEHKQIGHTSELVLNLRKNDVRFLGLAEREIGKLSATLNFDGRFFRISLPDLSDGSPGVLHIETFCNGKLIKPMSGNFLWNGAMDLPLEPGLEPEEGAWNFIVTEILSGQTLKFSKNIESGEAI